MTPEIASVLAVTGVLLTHRLLRRWIMRRLRFEARVYRGPVIAGRAAREPWLWAVIALASGVPAIAWAGGGAHAGSGWGAYADVPGLRAWFGLIAAILGWAFSAAPVNHYLARRHIADRLLLVALAAGVWWHPALAGVFVTWCAVMVWQYDHPRCLWYSWTHIRLPTDALILLSACVTWGTIAPGSLVAGGAGVLVLTLSLLAVEYFIPALAKLRLDGSPAAWVRRNRIHYLFVSGWTNGWLAFLREPTVVRIAHRLAKLNIAMAVATILLEAAAPAMLAHRWVAVVLIGGLACMQTGIYLASGICFWKWAVAGFSMAALVAVLPAEAAARVFTPANLLLSLGVIAAGNWVFRPEWLGWRDTRLNNRVRIEGVGASGRRYDLDGAFFGPYETAISMGRLWFLDPGAHLVGTWGCNARRDDRARGLTEAIEATMGDARAIDGVKQRAGVRSHDEAASRCFDGFVLAWLAGAEVRRTPRTRARLLSPPRHLHVRGRRRWDGSEQLERVLVIATETYFDDSGMRPARNEVIRDIELRPRVVEVKTPIAAEPAAA